MSLDDLIDARKCEKCGHVEPCAGEEVTRTPTPTPVRFRAHALIERAVSEGVAYGHRRAYKHTEQPTEDHVRDQIEQAVMFSLSEILNLDGDE